METILTSENLSELFSYLAKTLVVTDPQIGQIICACSNPSASVSPLQLTGMFGETHSVEESLIDFVQAEDCECDCDVLKLSKGVVGFACSSLWLLGLTAKLFADLHDSGARRYFQTHPDRTLEVADQIRGNIEKWSLVGNWKLE